LNQNQLEDYIKKAADTLTGMAESADVKQFIFPILFYKRISDVWDQEHQDALELFDNDVDSAKLRENYRFQIPEDCHWEDIRSTATDIGSKIQNHFGKSKTLTLNNFMEFLEMHNGPIKGF